MNKKDLNAISQKVNSLIEQEDFEKRLDLLEKLKEERSQKKYDMWGEE